MKVWDLRNDKNQLVGFEISSLVGRRAVRKLLERIQDVTGIRARRRFELSWEHGDTFCLFEYRGVPYIAAEPFGDNSRFTIQAVAPVEPDAVAQLRNAFQKAYGALGLLL